MNYRPGSIRFRTKTAVGAPPSLDWRNEDSCDWTTPIHNQGPCGSCWAFGSVAAIESLMEIGKGDCLLYPARSEQFMVSCTGGNCDGWYLDDTADFLKDVGTTDEACFPYQAAALPCSDRCEDWQDRIVKISGWGWVGGSPGLATEEKIEEELETFKVVLS